MDTSAQKIFLRSSYLSNNYFKYEHMPVPVFFAVPTLAFKVSSSRVIIGHNIIQDMINRLMECGLKEEEIAEKLCLPIQLVQIVVLNSKKNETSVSSAHEDTKNANECYYIFYNLLNNEFIEGKIKADVFEGTVQEMESQYEKKDSYFHRDSLGDSYYREIYFLKNDDVDFDKSILPTKRDIAVALDLTNAFDSKGYDDLQYCNEMHRLWLCSGIAITEYTGNSLIAIDPFSDRIKESSYFYNMLDVYGTSSTLIKKREEFRKDTKDYFESQNDLRAISLGKDEKAAYDVLKIKYGKSDFFVGKLAEYLSRMEASRARVTSTKNAKTESKTRDFYDCANNVIELMLRKSHEVYRDDLITKTNKDKLFDRLGKAKRPIDQKDILSYYYSKVSEMVGGWLEPWLNFDPDGLKSAVKNGLAGMHKDNIPIPLMVNIMDAVHFESTPFMKALKDGGKETMEVFKTVYLSRIGLRHSFDNISSLEIENVANRIYRFIDILFDIEDKSKVESSDASAIEEYTGSRTDIDDLSSMLQGPCNQLHRDIANRSLLFYADATTSLSIVSEALIGKCMEKFPSPKQLKDTLDKLPDDDDEAFILLGERLEKCESSLGNAERLNLNIAIAKDRLMKNCNIPTASSLIMFTPLLVHATDSVGFMSLYEELGPQFFNDVYEIINKRGHDNQTDVSDWKSIKQLNERFVKYCRIIDKYIQEEN